MSKKKQTIDITANNKNNNPLPSDLVFEILTRLPVKPLLQFKTVCKTWYLLVQDPKFVKLHHSRSKINTNPTPSYVLVIDSSREMGPFTMRLQSRDKAHVYIPNLNPNMLFECHLQILGICDGLVCATLENSEIVICNPTIGQVRKIPRSYLPEIKSDFVFNGFGLQNHVYKLFRIFYSRFENEFVRAEEYSVNTDIWREIGLNNTIINTLVRFRCQSCTFVPVAIDEVFYWHAIGFDSPCVVYFDTNGYILGRITLPKDFTNQSGPLDFKGELAFTQCDGNDWFEMWVLNKKEMTWAMKLRVGDIPSIGLSLKVLGCERNGNILMRYYSRGIKLISFDPMRNNIMYIPFAGILKHGSVYMYTESLLSISQ